MSVAALLITFAQHLYSNDHSYQRSRTLITVFDHVTTWLVAEFSVPSASARRRCMGDSKSDDNTLPDITKHFIDYDHCTVSFHLLYNYSWTASAACPGTVVCKMVIANTSIDSPLNFHPTFGG